MNKVLTSLFLLLSYSTVASDIRTLECELHDMGSTDKLSIEIINNKFNLFSFDNHIMGSSEGMDTDFLRENGVIDQKSSSFSQKPAKYPFSRFRNTESYKNRTKIKIVVKDHCVYAADSCYTAKLSIKELPYEGSRNLFSGKLTLTRLGYFGFRDGKKTMEAECKLQESINSL